MEVFKPLSKRSRVGELRSPLASAISFLSSLDLLQILLEALDGWGDS